MDVCTLILGTTLLSVPCQTEKSCSMTMDGKRQICVDYCRPPPNAYDCVRPDGTRYFWKPGPGEDVILKNM
jgi:hypothetical protein